MKPKLAPPHVYRNAHGAWSVTIEQPDGSSLTRALDGKTEAQAREEAKLMAAAAAT